VKTLCRVIIDSYNGTSSHLGPITCEPSTLTLSYTLKFTDNQFT